MKKDENRLYVQDDKAIAAIEALANKPGVFMGQLQAPTNPGKKVRHDLSRYDLLRSSDLWPNLELRAKAIAACGSKEVSYKEPINYSQFHLVKGHSYKKIEGISVKPIWKITHYWNTLVKTVCSWLKPKTSDSTVIRRRGRTLKVFPLSRYNNV